MNVKVFRMNTGEEVIFTLINEDDEFLEVENPLVALPNAQGQVGFAPWATVIDKDNPDITVSKTHVVYIAELDESIGKKYNEIYGSKLVTPDKKKLIL